MSSEASAQQSCRVKGEGCRLITIGKVSGVHGIRGQVKIQSFTEPSSALLKYKDLYWNYNNHWQLMPVVKNSLKANGHNFVANITDCHDRDEARKYQFVEIAVPRESLSKIDSEANPGEYYWADLEGLQVYTIYERLDGSKQYLGRIDQILATGSNDVLIVKPDQDAKPPGKEHLIPYLFGKYVLSVDLEDNSMIVDWDPEF